MPKCLPKQRLKYNKQPDGQQNALLAFNDDYDGDHLKQRQTADCLSELRSPLDSNNVLANTKRILSDNLANASEAPRKSEQSTREDDNTDSFGGGGSSSDKHKHQHSKRSLTSTSSRPSGGATDRANKSASSGGGSASQRRGDNHGCGPSAGGGRGSHSDQPAETANPSWTAAPTGATSDQVEVEQPSEHSKTNKKPASLLQNSLSRMSSKFNLFGSGRGVSAALSRQSRGGKGKQDEISDKESTAAIGSSQQEVALDAWIETKVVSYQFPPLLP